MGLWDGAPSPSPIDGGRWHDLFLFFQRQTSKKATARAVLQAFAMPQRSFTRNIEAAQKQYESELIISAFYQRSHSLLTSSYLPML